MNCKLFASVIALMFLVSGAAILSGAEDSEAAEITIVGYVGEKPNSGAPTPVVNKKITISDPVSGTTSHANTNAEGKFSIVADFEPSHLNNLIIEIDYPGYIFFVGPHITYNETACKLDLSGITPVGGVLTITDSISNCLLVSTEDLTLSFTIMGSEKVLVGATLTIYKDKTIIYTDETDHSGKCTPKDKITTGVYEYTLKCKGYKDQKGPLTITAGTTSIPLTMEEKTLTTYAGLTTYQIMMLAGVTIGITLATIAYTLCKRNWMNVDDSDD